MQSSYRFKGTPAGGDWRFHHWIYCHAAYPSTPLRTGLSTTSVVLTKAGTQVVAESRHHPYGTERRRSGTFPTDYRYTGQRREEGLGLYRMGARWYDPALSRWLSADTLVPGEGEPQSLNRYSWVLGNPLKWVDPTGHKEDGECGFNGEACIDVSILWDPYWLQFVGDPQAAEQAFLLFLTNPEYFISLYTDPVAWNASQEVANLEVFAEYSALHTTASQLVLGGFDPDTAGNLWTAHLRGDVEGARSLIAASGIGVVGITALSGDTCPQCGTVRPDLVRSQGALQIDPDGASVGCATCVDLGQSYMESGQGWRIPWSAVEAEAQASGVRGPEWTGPQLDHFGIFRDGPIDRNTPLWKRLNQFIRSFPKIKWGGASNKRY